MKQKLVLDLLSEALSENESLFLVSFDISASNKITIVVDGDEGVNLKECIRINKFIEQNLDREEEDFSLEVSSPDIADSFKNDRQFNKNIGRILKIKTLDDKFEGTLTEVTNEGIELQWKAREPKPIGKGKVTVTKNKKINFADITDAKVKIVF